MPHVDATAEVTNASVDNLKLIQLGKADIAFVLTDTLDDAIHGRGPFAKAPVKRARSRCSIRTTRRSPRSKGRTSIGSRI